MALQTKGFLNHRQRARHFTEHGGDFGAADADAYEQLADSFLGGTAPSGGVRECTRKMGDKVRYDPATYAYGVLDANGVIRTFYKPIPCANLPSSVRESFRRSGRCHPYASNSLYFEAECNRIW